MFKELQVVTLFGDMQITLSNYVEKMSDYKDNQQRWTCTAVKKETELLPQYDLTHRLITIKQQHVKVRPS